MYNLLTLEEKKRKKKKGLDIIRFELINMRTCEKHGILSIFFKFTSNECYSYKGESLYSLLCGHAIEASISHIMVSIAVGKRSYVHGL